VAENPQNPQDSQDPQNPTTTVDADATAAPLDDPPVHEPWIATVSLPPLPDDPPGTAPTRRRPDMLTLVVGLLTLAMSVGAFIGVMPDLSGFDPRWLLAGGAAAIGAMLLLSGLRHRASNG